MDISLTALLMLFTLLILALPLIGRRWSAIVSSLFFGSVFLLFSVIGFLGLSSPPAGPSHSFAQMYLVVAVIAALMLLITYFSYRLRNRKRI